MRMVDIHHEFPTSQEHRYELIMAHGVAGRQWVSTAVVGGLMRMKFARFEAKTEVAEEPHDWNGPQPYVSKRSVKRANKRKMDRRLSRYAGHENNGGRAEWDQ